VLPVEGEKKKIKTGEQNEKGKERKGKERKGKKRKEKERVEREVKRKGKDKGKGGEGKGKGKQKAKSEKSPLTNRWWISPKKGRHWVDQWRLPLRTARGEQGIALPNP
jgi:hypothetical protein